MRTFILTCGLLMVTVLTAQNKRTYYTDPNSVPEQHAVDFERLTLHVAFKPEEGLVMGTVEHTFKVIGNQTDTIFLHGKDIDVKKASLDNADISYKKTATGLVFQCNAPLKYGESHVLNIEYTAHPEKGIYFVGWNDTTGRCRKQIWTQGQGQDNRYWIPMFDMPNDKVVTDIMIEFETGYSVLSNGLLMSEKHNKSTGTTVWHYRMKNPHATYLIMLGIGKYDVKSTKSPSGVPMHFWYYPDWADRVDATFRYSQDMMRYLEEETGTPYPWNSYSQIMVQDFLYGAMENTTATVFGDFYATDERGFDDRNYVRVNAHELAHQWFGDYVTARTSEHTWLQESFATHYDLRYQGVAFGKDFFDWTRRQATVQALAASERDLRPIANSEAGSVRHYPKGAYVIQMLRDVAGDENYKRAIQYYLRKYGYGNMDSEDLLIAFHESAGLSLDGFWEEWVYKGGEPHYKVAFEALEKGGKSFGRFTVEQVQEVSELSGLFTMPINFEIHLKNGNVLSETVRIKDHLHLVEMDIPGKQEVDYALFDVGSRVMKKVSFEKPYDMLRSQAFKAVNMLDRYDAVVAMTGIPLEKKKADLIKLLESKDFHAVRSAALQQLLADTDKNEWIRKALNDADVDVRKAAIGYTSVITLDLLPDFEKMLTDSSYEIVEWTLEKLCKQHKNKATEYLNQTAGMTGVHEKNIRLKWLQLSFLQTPDIKFLEELKDYVSPSFEFRTRVSAANRLKELNYLDEQLIGYLYDALFSFNPRLRGPAKEVLDYYSEQVKYQRMMALVVARGNWSAEEYKRLNRLKLQ